MQETYSQRELDEILSEVKARQGWDFSAMNVVRQPVPWEYQDVVRGYLRPADTVLDVGTGGGEQMRTLAPAFGHGLGIDIDPEMVRIAGTSPGPANLSFRLGDHRLGSVPETFDVVLCRQAPFDLDAVAKRLRPGGYFLTQQVGERNMACVKDALGQADPPVPVSRDQVRASGLRLVAFMEYDVEYVVRDIESLVFWLNALDLAHADVCGASALASADDFNTVLAGNVDDRGFVTNEHRYLVIAQRALAAPTPRTGPGAIFA